MLHRNNNPVGTVSERITVPISGMACSSCVRHVEGALRDRDGVLGVSVSLKPGQAIVDYDTARVTPDDIRRTIEAAGYKAA